MTLKYWEDFPVGKIEKFGNKHVSEQEVVEFATEFDPQPFHIDKKAAEKHFFGGLIASGWQTASFLMRMIVDEQIANSTSMGSPGVDQLRWKSPVRPGETLTALSEVLESIPSKSKPDRGFITFAHTVFNQDDEIKMTMTSKIMFKRRPVGGSENG